MLAGFLEIFWKGVVRGFYVFPFSVAQVLNKVGGWVCERRTENVKPASLS